MYIRNKTLCNGLSFIEPSCNVNPKWLYNKQHFAFCARRSA